ncbi:MAG: sulfotransferase domain-containing protein [Chlamydiales bacterium]|nr:sulfotransferase domain-containing protein [Chlamydiales bacterium]
MRLYLFAIALVGLFVDGFSDQWEKIYLTTYPRSGNHWLRFLIEEATHTATSSAYCDKDYPHLPDLFPWGAFSTDHGYNGNCIYPKKNDIVVIKTHYPYYLSNFDPSYTKAIRVIRHPIDSIYSFYAYHHPNHHAVKKIPDKWLVHAINSWKIFHDFWDHQPNTVTFIYEDLMNHPLETLSCILEEIGYVVSEEDIVRAINKYPPQGGILKHFNHFTKEDIALIDNRLQDKLLQYHYNLLEATQEEDS